MFFTQSVFWYTLSTSEINAVWVAWEKIIEAAQKNSITKQQLLDIMNEFASLRSFVEKQQAFFDSLILYLLDEWSEDAVIPRSIKDMQQKDFSWSDLVFEEVLTQNEAYTRFRISYTSNGLTISGIMNVPTWDWPYPLVILNHWYINPAVYTVWRWLKREQDYLARNWFVVLHTDYRNHGLSDTSPELDQLYYFRSYFYGTDVINAVAAVKALNDPKIDTENVAMMGHSMGWGVTMHAILAQPGLVDAAVMYAPVHVREKENFNRWRREDLSRSELQELTNRIWNLDDDTSFAPYSANTYLDQISIPMQYYHGTRDSDVPYDRSVEAVEKLSMTNNAIELITFDGELHEFWFRWNDFMSGVVEFLDEELK